jgi:hypothetical protein
MKKLILSSLLLLFYSALFSQGGYVLWSGNIGLTGGYTPGGFATNIEFNYVQDYSYFQGALHLAFAKDTYEASETESYEIPYTQATVNIGYFFNIYENRPMTVILSLGGGAVGGYEIVNNGDRELPNGALIADKSKFIYGAYAGGEFDFNITRALIGVVKYNHYYHANSDVGNLTFYSGAGLRYFLN